MSPGTLRGNQAGTTYNPGTLAPGITYFWRIDEKNETGTTAGAVWSFTTQLPPSQAADFDLDGDVDQSDFGHLEVCFSPTDQPVTPDCLDADLDLDGNVDGADLDLFQACMAGPNQPPGC